MADYLTDRTDNIRAETIHGLTPAGFKAAIRDTES